MADQLVFFRIDGDGDVQARILAANVVTLVGAIITIVSRFISRRISKTKLGLDDWLVIPALICAIAYFGNLCDSLSYGFGKYIGGVSFAKLRQSFLGIFVGELLYAYSLVFTKFSILALYSRLFDQKSARIYCWTMAGINGTWMIVCTILSCLQCQPTHGFWDRNIPAKCDLDIKATFLGLGIITILTDVALVALPTYVCWRLSLSSTKKILLCGVFITGLFVTVASGVRLKAILELDVGMDTHALNITWTFSDTALWSGVEVNMAIVSSCLPVLRPLIAKVVPAAMVPTSLRKPGQPASYYTLGSRPRKPSLGVAIQLESRSKRLSTAAHPDLEAQGVLVRPEGTRDGDHELLIEEAARQQMRALTQSRRPTPPPKDPPPVMRAALTRPSSHNMDFAFAEANADRLDRTAVRTVITRR